MKSVAAVSIVSEHVRRCEDQHVTLLLLCEEQMQPTCSSLTAGVMVPELYLALRITSRGMGGLSASSDSEHRGRLQLVN